MDSNSFDDRLQLPSKVFISQDIYGMDMSKSDPSNNHNNHNNNSNVEAEGVTEVNHDDDEELTPEDNDNNEESAPLNGGELDEDAMECVICLTDPREVMSPC